MLVQMSFPGAPAIFYGDEVGVTGGPDPYNRGTYPWADKGGDPDTDMLAIFKQYIAMRNAHAVLRRGSIDAPVLLDDNRIVLVRTLDDAVAVTAFTNATSDQETTLSLPDLAGKTLTDALDSSTVTVGTDGAVTFTIPALSGRVLIAE
uniref:CAZy families GH13/CBM34 protein n=1 Tax=uncultured Herpetosiphon sp. TaxID=290606 RepID=A0A060BZ18_9CHLR|nr:CAZy families GH13/CBM34 protein [uncultured Herpetosiphon sp.]